MNSFTASDQQTWPTGAEITVEITRSNDTNFKLTYKLNGTATEFEPETIVGTALTKEQLKLVKTGDKDYNFKLESAVLEAVYVDGTEEKAYVYTVKETNSPTDYAAYTGDKKTVTVGETTKYFKKETTYGPTGAQAGNTVVYDSKDDGTAGVKLNSTAVDASYKKFTGYKYNKTTTEAAGKQSDTVAVNKIATVELYYELTSYKGKYFVESDDQSKEPTAENIKIGCFSEKIRFWPRKSGLKVGDIFFVA